MACVSSMASQGDCVAGSKDVKVARPSVRGGPDGDFKDGSDKDLGNDESIVDKGVDESQTEDVGDHSSPENDCLIVGLATEVSEDERETRETEVQRVSAETQTIECGKTENTSINSIEIQPDDCNRPDLSSESDSSLREGEPIQEENDLDKRKTTDKTVANEGKPEIVNDRRTELSYSQVCRLHLLMFDNLCITSNPHYFFPTINVPLHKLVQTVKSKLIEMNVPVRDIRLNGGAASHILCNDLDVVYNDLDLIFGVDLGASEEGSERVKHAVLLSLQEFMVDDAKGEKPSLNIIEEVYIHKMVRVSTECNKWSLISLSNSKGYDVELKFVDRMKRQFEFSVDSFQIILDNLFIFYANLCQITKSMYPRVCAESVYGPIATALDHLNRKLIATDAPEQIRGGGLLKYCHLIARGYEPPSDYRTTEKYMCSRFFIDFPDIKRQQAKLEAYLTNHFCRRRGIRQSTAEGRFTKYDFLLTLYSVVEESTVCLMGQERMQTLQLISALAQRTLASLQLQYIDFSVPPPSAYGAHSQSWRRKASVKNRPGQHGAYPMLVDGRQQYYPGAYQLVGPAPHSNSHMVTSMMPCFNYYLPYYVVSSSSS